jgi:hypothetical protein
MSSDLATVDAMVTALYEAERHTSEKPQDLDRFRTLFMPNALLVQTGREYGWYYVYDLEGYISEAEDLLSKHPLTEWLQVERVRDINQLGEIAHVFSTYDQRYFDGKRTTSSGGVNSFHLAMDNQGNWHITSWHWSAEIPHHQD